MHYLSLVRQIRGLRWEAASVADLQGLMVLSCVSGREFATSLRIARAKHPEDEAFRLMAAGELDTDNLQFDDYHGVGDHYAFLWHFLDKYEREISIDPKVESAAGRYGELVQQLSPEVRVMSIVSRERELPGVFTNILRAKGWESRPELRAFRYYLERHIELDSGEGGHADLLKGFPVDDSVSPFYEIRLEMYSSIPVLFS